VALTIARKIFLAFCLVLLVVLGLGLWSLQATRRLHNLNQSLLTQAIPAVRDQLALIEQISTLIRHETRAIVLRDSAYQTFHLEGVREFRSRLEKLSGLLEGGEAQEALARARARFSEYERLVGQEWDALNRGRAEEALRLSGGATRQSADALRTSLETLLTQSQTELQQKVTAAGGLERAARTATIVSLGLSLAVGLGVAGMVAVRIARPIRALGRATALVAQGEYDLPVVVESRDEVGSLARAFREMARKLGEIDALKEEFFSTISHELRSPLTSIREAVSLLREGVAGPVSPNQERLLQIVRSDAEKLLRLINQILDLSKFRSGMLQLDLRRADLRRIMESAAQELRPLAEERGVTLTVAVPESSQRLICDEERIQQVLVNLLSNAVKFTPSGGMVRLSTTDEGETIIVNVEDTGIGIPAGHLPHIFERYHQAHRGRGGTGLGLSIVKGFVEAHGGRVWTESEEGKGSRFHVSLPRNGTSG